MADLVAEPAILMYLAVQVALVLQTKDMLVVLVPRIPRPILEAVVEEQAQLEQAAAAPMVTVVQDLIHQLLVAQLVMLAVEVEAAKATLILQQRMVGLLVTILVAMVSRLQSIQEEVAVVHQQKHTVVVMVDQVLLF
jgi:hypothetical protein